MNNRDTLNKAKFIFDILVKWKYINQDKKFEDLTINEMYKFQNLYDQIANDFKPTEPSYQDK